MKLSSWSQRVVGMLTLVLCTSTLFTVSVAKLDKEDLAAIAQIVRASEDRTNMAIAGLQTDFASLKTDFANLVSATKQGFLNFHNFGRDRVYAARIVTDKIAFKDCAGSATVHGVLYGDRVAMIFSPHFNCQTIPSSAIHGGVNKSILLHDYYDLAFITGCPDLVGILNITTSVVPAIGDQVSSFGYGHTAKFWLGYIADIEGPTTVCSGSNKAIHWSTSAGAHLCGGEYFKLAQGSNHGGHSGSPVFNGYGAVGMAHLTLTSDLGSAFAGIIGYAVVGEYIAAHMDDFSTLLECQLARSVPLIVVSAPNLAEKFNDLTELKTSSSGTQSTSMSIRQGEGDEL